MTVANAEPKTSSVLSLCTNPWPSALAPMQDVTGLPFMRVIAECGSPDFYFTEFFRVYPNSKLDPEILSSITRNPSGKPIFAQLIGESIPNLDRIARELQQFSIAGVDLNMGCPAPRVYKKNVGGGLLKDSRKIELILKSLRREVKSLLTVKMRIGFEDDRNFEDILSILNDCEVDLLSLHTRTVLGGYRTDPDHEYVARAVERLDCPVLLNGNVTSAKVAYSLKCQTGAAGVMIGRSAIRNPWIFRQIREMQLGMPVFEPRMNDLYKYVQNLFVALGKPEMDDRRIVGRIKKFLNFVGLSVCPEGKFLHQMRRSSTPAELFRICEKFMISEGLALQKLNLEPFDSLLARPSQESVES